MRRDHRTTVTNVLVIGSGGAGLRAAIAAHDAGREVTIVGKRLRTDAHTVLAAGGINAALGTVDPEDTPRWHFVDTWNEGYHLADPRKVELLVEEAPERIRELAEWGMPFARTDGGELDQRYFGAHRYRRTCYAGDWTGRAMLETLHEQVRERGIPIVERTYVSSLLVTEGTCFGALTFDLSSGERVVHLADAVVLAGGGHTRLWRRSSSRRDENNGDAMYLALAAGAELVDLELVQFHPTGMTHPEEWAGQLVTEAVRGEGGHLKNADGERFMERYDPERLELSTRDRVALANYTEIREGRGGPNGGVFLDISHLDRATIREKLPRMHRQLIEAQMLDIAEQPIEVAPTAHYSMGGVHVDPATGASGVDGLFAAGEITGGLHGANRLGGNSLTETVVFGRRAGEAAAVHSDELSVQLRSKPAVTAALEELDAFVHEGDEVVRVGQRELRDIMWEHVGVVRDEQGLDAGVERLLTLRELIPSLDVQPDSQGHQDLAGVLDLRGSIVSALATAQCAKQRRETRGAQQREDHPDRDDEHQLVNYLVRLDDAGELACSSQPRVEVPDHLADWARPAEAVDASDRLLE
ncbi:FAD-dependent oxidoreductase [Egicoccus halophilus]|uniref:L-aspartate oxidase n=1 Tax=Egicoccus halophilus TaxID=1670830 RepID=A0A8J3A850_9ACTN|nr:FAD-dependent oxidoreductase [Egicoccus halophilus]GGI06176.1 oxidoreductase [Egicoccus halophilus]